MTDFLDWLARGTGVIAALLALLGFMFREKWKQLLQRSLARDLAKLKNDFERDLEVNKQEFQRDLEANKYDFQRDLEAYKVTLIAAAEGAKAQAELRKSIAMRYAEIEFERLVALELALAPLVSEMLGLARLESEFRSTEQLLGFMDRAGEFARATSKADMFLLPPDRVALASLRREFVDFAGKYIGPGKPVPPADDPQAEAILGSASLEQVKIMQRIRQLGALDATTPRAPGDA